MIRLSATVSDGEGKAPRLVVREFEGNSSIVIGRADDADFQIPGVSTVSRAHVRITLVDRLYYVEDLSTHGTLLDGTPLVLGEKRPLKNKSLIEMTTVRITCDIEEAQAQAGEQPIDAGATHVFAADKLGELWGSLGEANNEPYFLVLTGAHRDTKLQLTGDGYSEWLLGRSAEDCQLVLPDPNISRVHARIRRDEHGYGIEDRGSANGVSVNGKRLMAPCRLKDKDEIALGPMKLQFLDPMASTFATLEKVPGFAPAGPDPLAPEPTPVGAPEPMDPLPEESDGNEDAFDHGPDPESGQESEFSDELEAERGADDPQRAAQVDLSEIPEDLLAAVDPRRKQSEHAVIAMVVFLVLILFVLLMALY